MQTIIPQPAPSTKALWAGRIMSALPVLLLVFSVTPRTSVLGAILLTGFLGRATLTHLRVGEPLYLPVLGGVLVWGGLFLRDPRLRALVPFRRAEFAETQQQADMEARS